MSRWQMILPLLRKIGELSAFEAEAAGEGGLAPASSLYISLKGISLNTSLSLQSTALLSSTVLCPAA